MGFFLHQLGGRVACVDKVADVVKLRSNLQTFTQHTDLVVRFKIVVFFYNSLLFELIVVYDFEKTTNVPSSRQHNTPRHNTPRHTTLHNTTQTHTTGQPYDRGMEAR